MNQIVAPVVSEVTTTEALRSGGSTQQLKPLSPKQKSSVNAFIKAHRPEDTPDVTVDAKNLQQGLAQPQVSNTEQAAAVAARGHDANKDRARATSIPKRAYQVLYTPDAKFLQSDVDSYTESLKTGVKSLVDMAQGLSAEQIAMRKWLLTQLTLETSSDPTVRGLMEREAHRLQDEHRDYIQGTLSALQAGQTLFKNAPKLREFVKAYQLLDLNKGAANSDSATSEMIPLFRAFRAKMELADPTPELVNLHNGMIATVQRETTQTPVKATSIRQHLLLSRINQLRWLIRAVSLHQRFIACCQKAGIAAMPRLADLLEACLQTLIASDIYSGVNALVRMAGAVDSGRTGAQNIFITNYSRLVLQNPLVLPMYRGNFHRKQVVEHLDKTIRAAGLFDQPTAAKAA